MDHIKEFINYLKNIRKYSPHTILSYQTDLRSFHSFCKKDLLEIKRRDIRNWIINLIHSRYSPRSVNRKIHSLKSFYRFCIIHKKLENNPINYFYQLRFTKYRPVYIPQDKMFQILNGIDPKENRKLIRDKLILELLYMTGCRVDELINLKKKEINFTKGEIKLLGKGNKERIIPIIKRIIDDIGVYQKKWKCKNRTKYLLADNNGKRIYPMFVRRLIKKYFPFETTEVNASAHTFRHTFATHLAHNGAPLIAIKQLLGHTSLVSTSIYLHYPNDIIKRIYDSAHPKS